MFHHFWSQIKNLLWFRQVDKKATSTYTIYYNPSYTRREVTHHEKYTIHTYTKKDTTGTWIWKRKEKSRKYVRAIENSVNECHASKIEHSILWNRIIMSFNLITLSLILLAPPATTASDFRANNNNNNNDNDDDNDKNNASNSQCGKGRRRARYVKCYCRTTQYRATSGCLCVCVYVCKAWAEWERAIWKKNYGTVRVFALSGLHGDF